MDCELRAVFAQTSSTKLNMGSASEDEKQHGTITHNNTAKVKHAHESMAYESITPRSDQRHAGEDGKAKSSRLRGAITHRASCYGSMSLRALTVDSQNNAICLVRSIAAGCKTHCVSALEDRVASCFRHSILWYARRSLIMANAVLCCLEAALGGRCQLKT